MVSVTSYPSGSQKWKLANRNQTHWRDQANQSAQTTSTSAKETAPKGCEQGVVDEPFVEPTRPTPRPDSNKFFIEITTG
jgi:hypothetical protein